VSDWSILLLSSPFLNTGSYILPNDIFVQYDGKLTLNTRCIPVSELSGAMSIQQDYLDSNALFQWSQSDYGKEDSCCLVAFQGTGCQAGQRQVFCPSGEDYRIPFNVYSLMVYGCRGLKVAH